MCNGFPVQVHLLRDAYPFKRIFELKTLPEKNPELEELAAINDDMSETGGDSCVQFLIP